MDLYTIGHSKHPIDKFIQLLKDHRIEVLGDVRSTPYSRFNPQFNKNALQQSLEKEHIKYVDVGEGLGGRPKDPSCYKHYAIPGKAADYLHEVNYPEVTILHIRGDGSVLDAKSIPNASDQSGAEQLTF